MPIGEYRKGGKGALQGLKPEVNNRKGFYRWI